MQQLLKDFSGLRETNKPGVDLTKGYSVYTFAVNQEWKFSTTLDDVIGVLLKNARTKKGVSASQIGEEVNMGSYWIGRVESGSVKCPFSSFIQICWALELPLSEMLADLHLAVKKLEESRIQVVYDQRTAEGPLLQVERLAELF